MAKAKESIPESLLARSKWQASGIDSDTAEKLHLTGLTRAETKALGASFEAAAALMIPYFDLNGEPTTFYRVRYLEALPGFAGLAKKPQRYAQAPGSLNEVYPAAPPPPAVGGDRQGHRREDRHHRGRTQGGGGVRGWPQRHGAGGRGCLALRQAGHGTAAGVP
jgi:hypothetical protein